MNDRLRPFLPAPFVDRHRGIGAVPSSYRWVDADERRHSIGRLSTFMGNAGPLRTAKQIVDMLDSFHPFHNPFQVSLEILPNTLPLRVGT